MSNDYKKLFREVNDVSNYPNYRISVEIVILQNQRVLLTKRADDAVIAPGVWNVPAGKVKYEEVPIEAMYREAKEEMNLEVQLIKELDVRAFKGTSTQEEYYRCVFTYLVKPKNNDISTLKINSEHSQYAWVDKDDLLQDKYGSLHPHLRSLLQEQLSLTK